MGLAVARFARPSGRSLFAAERFRTIAPDIAYSSDALGFDSASGSCWYDADSRRDTDAHRQYTDAANCTLAAQAFSTLSPGSEFRPAHILAPLLSRHHLWPAFAEQITAGAEFPPINLSDADRHADVAASLARGNHKAA